MGEAEVRFEVDTDEAFEAIRAIRSALRDLEREREEEGREVERDREDREREAPDEREVREGAPKKVPKAGSGGISSAIRQITGAIQAGALVADTIADVSRAAIRKALKDQKITILGVEVPLDEIGEAIDDAIKEAQDQVIDRISTTLVSGAAAGEITKQTILAESALGKAPTPGGALGRFKTLFDIQDAQRRSQKRLERLLLGASLDGILDGAMQSIFGGK